MEKDQLRGKLRRIQQKSDLNEGAMQEQAAHDLLSLALASTAYPSSSQELIWQAIKALLSPPKATLVTAAVITQGEGST